jgi:hypothetical protein
MEKKKVFGSLNNRKSIKMKTISKTGVGELSSKILTGLLCVMMVNFVHANDVYVEQVGSSSTVTITQEGTGNKAGDSTNELYIGSGSNVVTIDQIGDSNILAMVVNGASADVTVNTTGSGNQQTINCGTTSSAGCSGSTITQTVDGDDNTITQNLGAGANHISNITVTGSDNIVTHTSTATGTTTMNATITGSTNTVGVTQSGMTTQNVTINSTGNSNTITVNQSN